MEWMWIIYWIDILGNLSIFFILAGVALLFVSGAAFCESTEDKNIDNRKSYRRFAFYSLVIPAFLFTFAAFIPSTKIMHTMIAASAVQDMSQNISDLEGIEEVPQELLDFVRQQLKDGVKD